MPRAIVAAALLLTCSIAAHAQTAGSSLTPRQIALACAPPAALADGARHPIRIAGAQDTVARSVFDDHDLLILRIASGASARVGEEYFVRRPIITPNYAGRPNVHHPIHTAGWVRVVAVNDSTAIALVEHACSAMYTGDHLEPFAPPSDPGDVQDADSPAGLDFAAAGRVMFGQDEHAVVSPGEFLLIDRGARQGVTTGERFAVYRDVPEFSRLYGGRRSAGLPLAAVGEGVVVASGPSTSVVKLLSARDAVRSGDIAVPRK